MKYKDYFNTYKIEKWESFYINYAFLKGLIKKKKYDLFWKVIDNEMSKIIVFSRHFRNNLASFQEINQYIILNYMTVFKAMKKYDKKYKLFAKENFFMTIKSQEQYKCFLKQKREKNEIKCIILDTNCGLFNIQNIIHFLIYLKERNIKIAITTNESRRITNNFIKSLKLEPYIEMIVSKEDILSKKPSPESIWEICSGLGVHPSETIIAGSTISDIYAGLNAKCAYVLGILSDCYDPNKLEDADAIFKDINGIPGFLRSIEMLKLRESHV